MNWADEISRLGGDYKIEVRISISAEFDLTLPSVIKVKK